MHRFKKLIPALAACILLLGGLSCNCPWQDRPVDYDRLYAVLDRMQDDFSRDLIELLSVPSISSDRAEVRRSLYMILEDAGRLGFSTRTVLDGEVGIAEIGPEGAETVGILAHVDVVPVEDQSWSFPPFEGTLSNGWFLGRGAMDDKGPALVSLYAAAAVARLGRPLRKKIQIIIGTREEITWTDMQAYVAHYPLPDYGFTPDDAFPGSNREKGYADILWTFAKTDAAAPAAGFRIVGLTGGNAVNTVPAQAEAILEGDADTMKGLVDNYQPSIPDGEALSMDTQDGLIRITATGNSVHSSVPETGINAMWPLMRFLSSISLASNGADRLVAFVAQYLVDDHYGKKLGLWADSDYLNGEYIGHTTVAPTLLATGNDSFSITCNLRTSFGIGRGEVDAAMKKVEAEFSCQGEMLEYLDPLYIPKNTPFMEAVAESYTAVTGDTEEMKLAMGTSYAKAMPNIVAWGPLFPGDTDYCHMADERINAESIMKAGKVYARLLATIALSKESFKPSGAGDEGVGRLKALHANAYSIGAP